MPLYIAKRRILKSPPIFTPASIPNLQIWLDAQTLNLSNGASVTSWVSTSPATIVASASTAPTMATNSTANGKKAVLFTGASSQTMSTTFTTSLADFSVAVVFKDVSSTFASRLVDKSFTAGFWTGKNATVNSNTWGGGVEEGSDPYGTYIANQVGQFNIVSLDRSGTTKTIWMNGPAVNSVTTVSSAATDTRAIYIGSDSVGGGFFDGYIAEIVLYSKAVTLAERLNLHQYLGKKYQIAVS